MENYKSTADFTCKEIRADARKSLKGKWGTSVGITVVFVAISIVISLVANWLAVMSNSGYLLGLFFGLNILWFLVSIFVTSPLTIGFTYSFIKLSDGATTEPKDLFSKFNLIFKSTGMMVMMYLKVLVWSLLFIIPGFVASFNYSMAPFIMAEDEGVGAYESIDISKKMMKGYKGKLFLLMLSFIGWMLLSIITFGIGFLWSIPYMTVAEAKFYRIVSDAYLQNKKAQPEPEQV